MRRDLERRLIQAEFAESANDWIDRKQARHRQTLRHLVVYCTLIRKRLLLMGIDPTPAVMLQVGNKAAAELDAIPDSLELLKADIAITRGDDGDRTEAKADFGQF